jgi:hypothetical protein
MFEEKSFEYDTNVKIEENKNKNTETVTDEKKEIK